MHGHTHTYTHKNNAFFSRVFFFYVVNKQSMYIVILNRKFVMFFEKYTSPKCDLENLILAKY